SFLSGWGDGVVGDEQFSGVVGGLDRAQSPVGVRWVESCGVDRPVGEVEVGSRGFPGCERGLALSTALLTAAPSSRVMATPMAPASAWDGCCIGTVRLAAKPGSHEAAGLGA